MSERTMQVTTSERRSEDHLKSLTKLVRILECFSRVERTLSLGDLCRRTGMPKSTAHRMVSSLREVGFLEQARGGDHYRLGLKLFEFGSTALANMELHREARPIVGALSRLSGEVVHLAVFDGAQAVVIHRSDPAPEGAGPLTFLEVAPLYCTGVGKAILAFQPGNVIERLIGFGLERYTEATIVEGAGLRMELAQVRERGFSVDRAEHEPGVHCVGAPIRDAGGRVFASISISGPARRMSETEALARIVVHHAEAISAALGFRRPAVPNDSP
jgi:IclR family transcriptional regulator, KDG regulon repressor